MNRYRYDIWWVLCAGSVSVIFCCEEFYSSFGFFFSIDKFNVFPYYIFCVLNMFMKFDKIVSIVIKMRVASYVMEHLELLCRNLKMEQEYIYVFFWMHDEFSFVINRNVAYLMVISYDLMSFIWLYGRVYGRLEFLLDLLILL